MKPISGIDVEDVRMMGVKGCVVHFLLPGEKVVEFTYPSESAASEAFSNWLLESAEKKRITPKQSRQDSSQKKPEA